jgi:hypothetical protein
VGDGIRIGAGEGVVAPVAPAAKGLRASKRGVGLKYEWRMFICAGVRSVAGGTGKSESADMRESVVI